MPICPNCKSEVEAGVKFCMECGSPIPQNKVCPQCGTELPLAAKFCFGCGANLAGGNAPTAGLAMGDKNVIAGDVIGQKVAGDNVSSKVMGNIINNTIKDDTKSVNTCAVCGVHMTNDTGHTCPKCGETVCADHFDSTLLCCKACAEKQQASMGMELCGVCGRRLIPGTGYVCRLCGKPTCEKHFDDDMLCCKACAVEQKKQAAAAEKAKQKKIAEEKAAAEAEAKKIAAAKAAAEEAARKAAEEKTAAEEAARRIAENCGTFTDPRDGQVYKTVKIGNQVWLAENFRYRSEGSYFYDNDNRNIKKYGRLYTWEAAMNCAPPGWHLPSQEEWDKLKDYMEDNADAKIGTALMSKTDWETGPQGTDEFSFCVLPAGIRYDGGHFQDLGWKAFFWISVEHHRADAPCCLLEGISGGWINGGGCESEKTNACSVRLIKEDEDFLDAKQKRMAEEKAAAEEAARRIAENCGTFTDPRDGQVYKTIKIGNQEWLAENFRYKSEGLFHFKRGSYAYDNDDENVQKYGRLYTWEAAMKCAPPGWHLPSQEEWNNLQGYVEAHAYAKAGTALKSKTDWEEYEDTPQGTDEFGFCALPAGCRNSDGDFCALGSAVYFWSSTEDGYKDAYRRFLFNDQEVLGERWSPKICASSVRLLKDK